MNDGTPTIAYLDFAITKAGWFSATHEVDEAVRAANAAIAERSLAVINVETVAHVASGFSSHVLRVWYRAVD